MTGKLFRTEEIDPQALLKKVCSYASAKSGKRNQVLPITSRLRM